MVVILWFIWIERNLIREEGHRRSTEAIAWSIEFYANENSNLYVKELVPSRLSREKWTA